SDSFVASAAVSIATGWSEPVPGRDFHPLKSSAFSRRTVSPTTSPIIISAVPRECICVGALPSQLDYSCGAPFSLLSRFLKLISSRQKSARNLRLRLNHGWNLNFRVTDDSSRIADQPLVGDRQPLGPYHS